MKVLRRLLEDQNLRTAALLTQDRYTSNGHKFLSVEKFSPNLYITNYLSSHDYSEHIIRVYNFPGDERMIYDVSIEGAKARDHHVIADYVMVVKKVIPEFEPAVLKQASTTFQYAKAILKAPWPAGEPILSADTHYSYWYALEVLKGPFPAGEAAIARDAKTSYLYAVNILKARFKAGEKVINNTPHYQHLYHQFMLSEGLIN